MFDNFSLNKVVDLKDIVEILDKDKLKKVRYNGHG